MSFEIVITPRRVGAPSSVEYDPLMGEPDAPTGFTLTIIEDGEAPDAPTNFALIEVEAPDPEPEPDAPTNFQLIEI